MAALPMVHDSHCKPSLHAVSLPSSQSCSANMPACNSHETTGRNSSRSLPVCGLFLVKQGHVVSASGCANATRQVQVGHSSTLLPTVPFEAHAPASGVACTISTRGYRKRLPFPTVERVPFPCACVGTATATRVCWLRALRVAP